jgi:transcriptional regulator with XRE-family HTH domain
MQRSYSEMTAADLQRWRQKQGLTVRDAGAELGVSERTMFRLLNGKGEIPLTVARLAWALSCIDLLQDKLAKHEERPPPRLNVFV